ncbi:glycosyltransferase, partial [Niallia circulans]
MINIVCACDDRYVKHLAVLIISIINNTKTRNINFYIINGGIHQENIDKLEEIFITNKAKFRFLMTNEEEIKKL